MELDYFRIILSLLASVALGVAIIYFMSRYGAGRGRKLGSVKRVAVQEVHPLGNRTSLVALTFCGNDVLMVVGPGFASVAVVRPISAPLPVSSNPHEPEGAQGHVETAR